MSFHFTNIAWRHDRYGEAVAASSQKKYDGLLALLGRECNVRSYFDSLLSPERLWQLAIEFA